MTDTLEIWDNRYVCLMNDFERGGIKRGGGTDAYDAMQAALGLDELTQLCLDTGFVRGEFCSEGVQILTLDEKPIGIVICVKDYWFTARPEVA